MTPRPITLAVAALLALPGVLSASPLPVPVTCQMDRHHLAIAAHDDSKDVRALRGDAALMTYLILRLRADKPIAASVRATDTYQEAHPGLAAVQALATARKRTDRVDGRWARRFYADHGRYAVFAAAVARDAALADHLVKRFARREFETSLDQTAELLRAYEVAGPFDLQRIVKMAVQMNHTVTSQIIAYGGGRAALLKELRAMRDRKDMHVQLVLLPFVRSEIYQGRDITALRQEFGGLLTPNISRLADMHRGSGPYCGMYPGRFLLRLMDEGAGRPPLRLRSTQRPPQ